MPDNDEHAQIAAAITNAMNFDFDAFGWGPPRTDEIDRLGRDIDFESDFRNLLIAFGNDPTLDLAEHLALDCDSGRYLDLRRAYEVLRAATRDELTDLAIADSLCPIHFVDWAICFDDEPADCAQVRLIMPRRHDT